MKMSLIKKVFKHSGGSASGLELRLVSGEELTNVQVLEYDSEEKSAVVRGKNKETFNTYLVFDLGRCTIRVPSGYVRSLIFSNTEFAPTPQNAFPVYDSERNQIFIDGNPLRKASGEVKGFKGGKKQAKLAKLLCDAGPGGLERDRANRIFNGNIDTTKSKVSYVRRALAVAGYTIITTDERYIITRQAVRE